MSRGLGAVERAIIEALADESRSTIGLVRTVYGLPIGSTQTPAQHAAVRRALGGLQRKGLVERVAYLGRLYGSLTWAKASTAAEHRRRFSQTLADLEEVFGRPASDE